MMSCEETSAYVYMVKCADGSLYTGWTNNIENRLRAHNKGTGAKYTKTRRPVHLVYAQRLSDKKEAMRQEYRIKQLSREKKLELIATYHGELG